MKTIYWIAFIVVFGVCVLAVIINSGMKAAGSESESELNSILDIDK